MAIDLTRICEQYKGLWVALKEEDKQTVVASGETVQEVMKRAQEEGYEQPILFRVPTEVMSYIGSF